MARHRNIRNMNYDDYMDDYDVTPQSSYGSDYIGSPVSPSQQGFIFNREQSQGSSLSAFMARGEELPHHAGDNEPQQQNRMHRGPSADENPEELGRCVSALWSMFESRFSEAEMIMAARAMNYSVEEATQFLLDRERSPSLSGRSPTLSPSQPPIPAKGPPPGFQSLGPSAMASSFESKAASEDTTVHKTKWSPPPTDTTDSTDVEVFQFDEPSPDDLAAQKRKPTAVRDDIAPSEEAPSPSNKPTPAVAAGGSEEPPTEQMSNLKTDGTPSAATKPVPKYKKVTRPKDLEKAMEEDEGGKDKLNLICIGHVDAGKSTLMGHMLVKLGNVNKRTMHKYEKESKEKGKASFAFAWVLDESEEERNRGVTMDVCMTSFETDHKEITLLDAPGHKDFIPNMISGAAQADVAILVVDSSSGEFEVGFQSGGQTKEHAVLVRSLGVGQLIVAVNKLDTVNWSEERFKHVSQEIGKFLKQAGYREKSVWYVPCSGLTGQNLKDRSAPELEAWYNGPTLLEQIDKFAPAKRETSKPLRFTLTDIFKSMSLGSAVAGKVETGNMCVNDKVLLMPLTEICQIKSIERNGESSRFAKAGDQVSIGITGVEMQQLSVGSILCDPESPVPVASQIRCQVVTLGLKIPITLGQQVEVHLQSFTEPGVVSRLVSLLDKNSGEVTKKKPRALTKNQTAVLEVSVGRPVCVEKFSDFKQLGRVMLRSGGDTLAVGIVTKLLG